MAGDQMLTADQAHIARLEQRVRDLERELADKDQQIDQSRHLVEQGARSLRRALSPVYKALQQVFGDIDTLVPEARGAAPSQDPVLGAPYWDTWKSRVSPAAGRVIDLLRATPNMNQSQISAAVKMDPRTVSKSLGQLRSVGVLRSNGGLHALQVPGGGGG